jgi:hypothetical protein
VELFHLDTDCGRRRRQRKRGSPGPETGYLSFGRKEARVLRGIGCPLLFKEHEGRGKLILC